jgi:methyl-accepting chemotaxis protein/sigma-B regulation protein RsbU (phosphoserine phosphatase)
MIAMYGATIGKVAIVGKEMTTNQACCACTPIGIFNWYLFYKPFVRNEIPGRSLEELNWSIASVYPETDIVGEYYHLVLHVLGIVLASLLVFYILSRMAIRNLVKPLTMLTESAENIAEGNFDEKIPNTKRDDEAGVFQQHFHQMQQALEADITKLEQQQATLQERRDRLQKTYQQIQEDDQVKTTFLHNVSNKMIEPSNSILESIETLCDNYYDISLEEAKRETKNIKLQSETILELFNKNYNAPGNEAGKEEKHG